MTNPIPKPLPANHRLLSSVICQLEETRNSSIRVAFSRNGRFAWINEYTAGDIMPHQISPKLLRSELLDWLHDFQRMHREPSHE